MLAISNTSPLLYLHLTNRLDLLKRLYGKVHVAPAVLSELRAGAALGISVPEPGQLDWLTILPALNRNLMPMVTDLGAGETETIALGLEHPGSLVILDDLLGRRVARAAGLRVTGTLGVLLKAKRGGMLPSMTEAIDELRAAGMWIGAELAANVIAEAGEGTSR
jgi:predicted nucleic acid-binding protein